MLGRRLVDDGDSVRFGVVNPVGVAWEVVLGGGHLSRYFGGKRGGCFGDEFECACRGDYFGGGGVAAECWGERGFLRFRISYGLVNGVG